eukprot:2521621-Pyramimonas_sp.AAC.1
MCNGRERTRSTGSTSSLTRCAASSHRPPWGRLPEGSLGGTRLVRSPGEAGQRQGSPPDDTCAIPGPGY